MSIDRYCIALGALSGRWSSNRKGSPRWHLRYINESMRRWDLDNPCASHTSRNVQRKGFAEDWKRMRPWECNCFKNKYCKDQTSKGCIKSKKLTLSHPDFDDFQKVTCSGSDDGKFKTRTFPNSRKTSGAAA